MNFETTLENVKSCEIALSVKPHQFCVSSFLFFYSTFFLITKIRTEYRKSSYKKLNGFSPILISCSGYISVFVMVQVLQVTLPRDNNSASMILTQLFHIKDLSISVKKKCFNDRFNCNGPGPIHKQSPV